LRILIGRPGARRHNRAVFKQRVVASILCLCLLLAQFAGAGLVPGSEREGAAGHAHHAVACDDAGQHAHGCPQAPAADGDRGACPMSTGACCPGLAAALPRIPATATPGAADETIDFRSSLHLLSRAEGIFRPPRPIS
jgi:hypothetical protein